MIVSFKFYVMNFVDFVFDFCSHIISHVSQAFASCTHYTSYSLLNLVHYIVCDLVVAIQDYMFLDLMQNVLNVWVFENNFIEKLVFGRFGLNSSVFEKLFVSYSCILFIKQCTLRSFCINLLCVSNFHFSKFLIDRSCFSDWNCDINFWFESA